jgi:hypothetical protein
MQGKAWMELIAKIPAVQLDGLGLITSSGVEINIQTIFRMEEDYILLRGRLMGTTDAGRIFFVPYDQINCLVYQRLLKDHEVEAWFGAPMPSTMAAPVETVPAAESAPEETPVMQPLSTATGTGAAPLPGKAAILERLRKRTGAVGPGMIKPTLPGASAQGTIPKPPPEKP